MSLFCVTLRASCGQEVKVLALKLEIELRMKSNPLPSRKVDADRVPGSSQPFRLARVISPVPQKVEKREQSGTSTWKNSVMI